MERGRAYVLRCWAEGNRSPSGPLAWRFSIEEVGPDQQRRGFGSFDALVAYLAEALAEERTEGQRSGGAKSNRVGGG